MRNIFDTHLDLAWNALSWKRDLTLPLAEMNAVEADWDDHPARGRGVVSLPEMRRGRVAVALGTLMARWAPIQRNAPTHASRLNHRTQDTAYAVATGQLAYYQALEARGEVRLLHTAEQLRDHWRQWSEPGDTSSLPVGLIVAMEGCDAIVDPPQAEHWFNGGLRVASLVHYGTSAYAVGTGQDGPLTPRGREMLAAFERFGIVLDVTHLSDTSFDEAVGVYGGPLIASHNNCRAIIAGQRQFTDEQLRTVIDRGGIIGVAGDAWMLTADWADHRDRRRVPFDSLADHVDHICQLAGSCDHVGIGSDLDGGYGHEQCPAGLDSIADLQKLAGTLTRRGYSDDDVDAVFHRNFLKFFLRHLPAG